MNYRIIYAVVHKRRTPYYPQSKWLGGIDKSDDSAHPEEESQQALNRLGSKAS